MTRDSERASLERRPLAEESNNRAEDSTDERGPRPTRRRVLGATGASLAGVGAVGTGTAGASALQADQVTIVHDTHFHGRFGDEEGLNIARYRTAVEQQLDAHDNAAFVGTGDDLAPSVMGLNFQGEHMIEALNDFPILAGGVGNHEFDFGVDVATTRFRESEFPWVVANLLTPEEEPIPGTERWITREVGGITVGLFGSGVGDFHGITDYPEEYVALDPVEASVEATRSLRDEGADVVVMLSHTSSDTHVDIAEAADGLDAIVGSHSGVVFDEPRTVAGTVISEAGDEFDHLGVVTLSAGGDLVDWTRVDVTEDHEMHDGTRSIMETWTERLEERLGQPHFTSGGTLDARFDTNYARESGLGNLVTDVIREHVDADVGVYNAGGIRSDTIYGPGPITGLDVMDILPFPNTVVVLEITGERLRRFLESRVAALPEADFGAQQQIQVSGLQYEWSGHGTASVENVYVGGDPLDPDATYRFATIDFVAENREVLADVEWEQETDELVGTLVLDELSDRGHVEPEIEHRILRVDDDAGGADVRGGEDTFTVSFPRPDAAEDVFRHSFTAVTQWGHDVDPETVDLTDDTVEATFDADALRVLGTGAERIDLRLFGGFEPDDDHYGYEDDEGDQRDLPVAAAWPYYVVKADLGPGGGQS